MVDEKESALYDTLRQKNVKASPEECVRQNILRSLVEDFHFPKHLISVEVSLLSCIPSHQKKIAVPKRRMDIVCFDPFYAKPLLVIECKAIVINEKVKRQVIGYNAYLKAPFIGIASRDEILLGYQKDGVWHFEKGLISFDGLLKLL